MAIEANDASGADADRVFANVRERLTIKSRSGNGLSAICPAHADRSASLTVSQGAEGRVLLNCHAGCSIESICAAIGLEVRDLFVTRWCWKWKERATTRALAFQPRVKASSSTSTPAGSHRYAAVWGRAQARARTTPITAQDEPVHHYLRSRNLDAAVQLGLVGVFGPGDSLPEEIQPWIRWTYRVVAPLYNQRGELVTVQGRRITEGDPKTRFPKNSKPTGCMFANDAAVQLLRGAPPSRPILFGEGLTDFLALSICYEGPVVSAPGTDYVEPAIGMWLRGADVLFALDNDTAGRKALAEALPAVKACGARSARTVTWPDGLNDACDVLARIGRTELAALLLEQVGGADVR